MMNLIFWLSSVMHVSKMNQRGQTTVEYMLVLAVLVLAIVFAFWLLIPGIKDGFIGLARKIISS